MVMGSSYNNTINQPHKSLHPRRFGKIVRPDEFPPPVFQKHNVVPVVHGISATCQLCLRIGHLLDPNGIKNPPNKTLLAIGKNGIEKPASKI